jgi:UDP-N-acetylglucosamine diphosphorylase / glucose-1-phosphate thymidylyltransferase / UDP-N-acetylgalactosamine diphosphorylase / glucosamine-1-phosphate N-acetyltransferase / galactosamine-1-phosphate N-acetyltransferase
MPFKIRDYIASFSVRFPFLPPAIEPWKVTMELPHLVEQFASSLDLSAFRKTAGIFVHKEATIEPGANIKPPAIISAACFVASTAYLRGGVVLDHGVTIGPACELKSTIVMASSSVTHICFVGDSIIGSDVNIEGGVVVANHFNELPEQEITARVGGESVQTGVTKFGALIGDHSRIGANSVLTPGTVLPPNSVVARLRLVDQRADHPL